MRIHDLDDVTGTTDLADLLGVRSCTISNWAARHEDFPQPLHHVGRGSTALWSREAVLTWAANNGRYSP